MQFGFYLPSNGPTARPNPLTEIASRGEQLGFHFMVAGDHILAPRDIGSRYPYAVGGEFHVGEGGEYSEHLTLLTFLAGITRRIRLAPSVMIVPYRNPLLTAKVLPMVAAFFAAWPAWKRLQKQSEKESETGKEFAIWAIDLRLIRYARRSGHGSNVRLPEINVPRAKNPFLHAQHGLFIVDMDANGSWENGSSIPLDQVIGKFADWCKGRKGFWSPEEIPNKLLPPVPKIEVPVALAGDVLRILRNEGITLGHLMPNYDGVVSSIKLMRELAG